jgi:hypothetical protein
MIEIPLENLPCKSFSVITDIGTVRLRTYWNGLASMWYMDVLGQDGNNLLSGIAMTTGVNNLIAGCGITDFDGCAIFMVDTSGAGNRTFDGLGSSARMFMTMPGETIRPYAYQ